MSEFKVGQTLRRVKGNNRGQTVGYVGVLSKIEPLSGDHGGPWLTFADGHEGYATSFVVHAVSTGPVRTETVTKRRIVPGVYGRLSVGQVVNVPDCNNPDEPPQVRVDLDLIGGSGLTATELDDLAMVASQLAEALRDDMD